MNEVDVLVKRKKRHKPCRDDIPVSSISVESFVAGSDVQEEAQELWLNQAFEFGNDQDRSKKKTKTKPDNAREDEANTIKTQYIWCGLIVFAAAILIAYKLRK
ncbi:hypothetical protein GCK32_004533 [Trichostrongylus colubriformis]|uniref:Uncharacterized protein n=1 Tax=Trichostrongylus colubriformis TaxID=6319 RepID=A0AAN8F6N7_TRICO